MLVLVAHNGFSYELEANSETRIEKVKTALENLTGISINEQILTYDGSKLDGSKKFLDYGLSEELLLEGRKIFLYNRSLLQQDSRPPQPETLQPLSTDYPSLQNVQPSQFHSELEQCSYLNVIRQLAVYEQHFSFRVTKARAYLSVCSEYCLITEKLISQQEVQAQAIDSAQENVDKHYAYISEMYDDFNKKCISKVEEHDHLLSNFEAELERLAKIETHASVKHTGLEKLDELLPKQKLLQWHHQCNAMHTQFKPKVTEVSSIFASLKSSVEALFMTVPSVDLIKLSEQLQRHQHHQQELLSIIETLDKDFKNVKELYADVIDFQKRNPTCHLDTKFLDRYTALNTVNEMHVEVHLPRMEDCLKLLERFSKHCLACKNAMSRCVHSQMKSVAALQNHIRDVRNKLSAYKEVGQNIDILYSHLNLVYYIPKAYHAALAEVIRRKSFAEVFTLHAQRFAEAMASMRQQEETTRQSFQQNNEYFLPQELVAALSLDSSSPFCEVHVSPDAYTGIQIKPSDVQDSQYMQVATKSGRKVERSFMSSLEKFNRKEGDPFVLKMENAALKAQLASLSLQVNNVNTENRDSPPIDAKAKENNNAIESAMSAKDSVISSLMEDLSLKSSQIKKYETDILQMEEKLSKVHLLGNEKEISEGEGTHSKSENEAQSSLCKCVTKDFKVQDIALFLEEEAGCFEAYNDSCPNHFLSVESVDLIKNQTNKKFVIGQIVHIEERVFSGEEDDSIKKCLQPGDTYYVVTICLLS